MSLTKWFETAKSGLKDSVARFKNKDFLQAAIASAVYIAAADGTIDADEKKKMVKILEMEESLKVFETSDVVRTFNEFAGALDEDADFGAMAIEKAIKKVAGNEDQAKTVMVLACAIGKADGDFDDDEKAQARNVAKWLNQKAADYGI